MLTDTADFLTQLYGDLPDGMVAYLWTLQDKQTFWFGSAEIEHAVTRVGDAVKAREDTYCGIAFTTREAAERVGNSRRVIQCPSEKDPGAAVAGGVVALVADIDIAGPGHAEGKHHPPMIEGAVLIAKKCPHAPTCLVNSGGGVHAWWVFKEPWVFENSEDRMQALSVFRGWGRQVRCAAKMLKYDVDAVHDLARILRVVGTQNHKNPTARPVTIIESNWDRRYNPDDFADYAAIVTDAEATESVVIDLAAEFPREKYQVLCENLPELKTIFTHTARPMMGKSASEYDWRLACIVVDAGWSDDEVAALLRSHQAQWGDKPEKANRAGYYTSTIAKVRQGRAQSERMHRAENAIGDDTETHAARVAALALKLDIPLERVTRLTGPESEYRFYLGDRAAVISGEEMIRQLAVTSKIFDLTGRMMRQSPTKGSGNVKSWRDVVNEIVSIAEMEEGDPEACPDSELIAIIREYLEQRPIVTFPEGEIVERGDCPFRRGGLIWFRLNLFRAHMLHQGDRMERAVLLQRLRAIGASQKVHKVKVGANTTTRNFHGLPASTFGRSELRLVMEEDRG